MTNETKIKAMVGQLVRDGRTIYYAYINGKKVERKNSATIYRLLHDAVNAGKRIGSEQTELSAFVVAENAKTALRGALMTAIENAVAAGLKPETVNRILQGFAGAVSQPVLRESAFMPHASDCAVWVGEKCDCVVGQEVR